MVINRYNIVPGADLRRANLRGANLAGFDLTEVDLTEVDLTGADLRGADLRGPILRGAILRGADLRGAILRRANLTDANFRGANLTGADLTRATLPDAPSLKSCLALNSDIEGAITNVNQLLNLIESNKNNEEESNIYKGHLKWIEDNMEALIRNNHITDTDKATIDDRRDLSRLAQCSRGVKEITAGNEGLGKGLTGFVRELCVQRILQPNNGQEK